MNDRSAVSTATDPTPMLMAWSTRSVIPAAGVTVVAVFNPTDACNHRPVPLVVTPGTVIDVETAVLFDTAICSTGLEPSTPEYAVIAPADRTDWFNPNEYDDGSLPVATLVNTTVWTLVPTRSHPISYSTIES
jgi:hypothetical protein